MATITDNLNTSEHLELSIQISLDGISFCVLNSNDKLIIALKDVKFKNKLNPLEVLDQLKTLFDTEFILRNNFKNVIVIHDNELSTFVPKALFNEDKLSDYLKYNSKILKSDFITFDSIAVNDSVNVYMPYVNINNFIYDKYGTFTYNHVSTILIEQLLYKEILSDQLKFYANIGSSHFEIIVIDKGQLIFYNRFNYSSSEDFIYYTLFTIEQLKLNPEVLNLIFLGDIDTESDLYKMAYTYIRDVSFGNREDIYKFSLNANPKSNYSNFSLLKSL